jgi:glycosyltransferase involved in cell wall biosynthesis
MSMRRLRICQLITELGPAGAERCVYELARRLDRTRFDVQVAALRGGVVERWLAEAGVPVTVLNIVGRWDLPKMARLVSFLRRERIDFLHTHLFHADLVGRPAAYLAGVPHLVHTVHTAEGRFRPWQFAFARLAAGWCDRIVCVSRSARDFHAHRSGLPLSRYTVIPNGVDAAAFAREETVRQRLRQSWGVQEGDVLAAYVGRLDCEKGLDTLLAALDRLAAQQRPLRLVVAGDGPQRGMLENFIACAEGGRQVRYLGFVSDVRGVLSAADMLVMPSRWEGFGLAAAEAMAASLPVVATDVPGLRDVVQRGVTGLLVPRDDPAALASAIRQLSDDAETRRQMGQAGRERVDRLYPIEATIRAHEDLYETIADGRGFARRDE